jgi:tetratricopeptide (TPR) repeat protein
VIALFVGAALFIFGGQAGGGSAEPWLEAAMRKMEQRDYVGALVDLEKHTRKPSTAPMAYYQMGVCQIVLGRYEDALRSLERARAAGLDGWEVLSGLGTAHFHRGENDLARRYFERVLQVQDGEPTALFYLGRLDLKVGRAAEAEQKLRRVLASEPRHEGALFNLGRSLVLQGKTAEGKQVLEYHRKLAYLNDRLKTLRDMASAPGAKAPAFADLGNVYVELGNTTLALAAFEKAEKLEPAMTLTSLGRGKLRYYAGDFEQAEKYLRQALLTDPSACDGHLFLGLALKAQRNNASALAALETALQHCPRTAMLLGNIAELEIQRGNLDRALQLSADIGRLEPASPTGPYIAAVCRLYRKDLDGAERLALEAARLGPNDPEYQRLLRAIYQGKGDAEKVRVHEQQMQDLLRRRTPRANP